MCQLGYPIVYLQNTTGYMVGKDSEQGGMIKHGSKMIQAVTNATVPQITIQCGASFGAGNYGMCGRGYAPALPFQLAEREDRGDGRRAGRPHHADRDRGGAGAQRHRAGSRAVARRSSTRSSPCSKRQADAFYTSGPLLDDGVIDPRDTRARAGALPRRLRRRRRSSAQLRARCSSESPGIR